MIRFVKPKFSHTVADKSFISFMVLNLYLFYLFYLTLFFLFHRSISCTMMATRAFTTIMMQRADDISFIPRLRSLLLLLMIRMLVPKRKAEGLRPGLKKAVMKTVK